MFKAINLIGLILFIQFTGYAQKALRMGKVTKEDVNLTECAFYPEANAMILGESGDLRFRYNNDHGWQYSLDYVGRKKIFNEEGKDQSNIYNCAVLSFKGRLQGRYRHGAWSNLQHGRW